MGGYGQQSAARAGVNSIGVRNTFYRQQGRAGPEALDGNTDLKPKFAFKDVKYLILPVMDVQRRPVAVRHAVLKDRNTVFPVLLSYPDVHEIVEEPDPFSGHTSPARTLLELWDYCPLVTMLPLYSAQGTNISLLCALRKLFTLCAQALLLLDEFRGQLLSEVLKLHDRANFDFHAAVEWRALQPCHGVFH